jgi:hypothetical protein
MFSTTNALSLIEQLALSGERAWIGDLAPDGVAFVACDLHRRAGFRPTVEHFGRYDSVWLVQDALAIQGWRILLDSCVRMLAPQGTLVVRYVQNQHLSIPGLKRFLFRKYGIRVIVRAEQINGGEITTAFQVERDAATLPTNKTWTFGILTQGKKVDLVERFCRSVREFGGPDHEILIVGPRHSVYAPYDPVYIDKSYSTAFSDICVKKNDIVARAQHENICVLHDRYILNKDFFRGFDTFGYDFDFLTIRQHHASGKIYPSYCAMSDGGNLIWGPIYECGNENETWSRHYLNGGLIVAKRALLRAVPFNELIFHNQAEDVELADVLEGHSVMPRINRLASAVTDVPDHLTDAFAYAEHPWETARQPDPQVIPAPAAAPALAPAPLLTADVNGVPWRRLKGVERRVNAVGRRVRNLRRDGSSWLGVAYSATRFVHRRVAGRLAGTAAAATYAAMTGTTASASSPRQRPADSDGCNILLYAGDQGGVLNLTVHYMRRLQRDGLPFCIVAIDQAANNSKLPDDMKALVVTEPVYPRNIWCIGFPFISRHLHVYSRWAENRWNVNFTHWELPYIPQRLVSNFVGIDGLMTTTEFVRDALASVTSLPIEIVDPQVRVDPAITAPYDRAYFGLPENKCLFLLNWEFTSSTIRKNPAAGVRAFEEAFAGIEDRVAMVMHVKISAEKDEKTHEEYASFLADIRVRHPHVIVLDQKSFTYDEALGLKSACDCYVSLHRSEGYGMGCAEALSMGRYCVMTGWSGNMELLKTPEWRPRIATVEVALVPVTPADFPWIDDKDEVFQLWADVRPGDAVQKMRGLYAAMMEHKHVAEYAL